MSFQARKAMTINFVLANASQNSITGVVTNFANGLVRRGHRVIISYPLVDNWSFVLWMNENKNFSERGQFRHIKFFLRLAKVLWTNFFLRSFWMRFSGGLHVTLDRSVVLNRYFVFPNNLNMPDADYLVTLQEYLLPRLILLDDRKGRVVSSIRTDYQKVLRDACSIGRFVLQGIRIAQQVLVPRFALSVHARDGARALKIEAQRVIHNGIDAESFSDGRRRGDQYPLNVVCLVQPGRRQKGSDFALDVMTKVKEGLAGRGASWVVLKCFGDDLNLTSPDARVRNVFDEVLGFLQHDKLVQLLQSTDVFVFPSLYEGWGSLLYEAMACGCAVVTTDVAGISDLKTAEPFCLINKDFDAEKMSGDVLRLIDDTEQRDELRGNAVKMVREHFSWARSAEALEQFLLSQEL